MSVSQLLGTVTTGGSISDRVRTQGGFDVPFLDGAANARDWRIVTAEAFELAAHRQLRHEVFVAEQQLFRGDDHDQIDDDPRAEVLVAVAADGQVLGGVRIAPATDGRDLGWWTGSRLAVAPAARRGSGIGPALIRAACARVAELGVLRFEATVQVQHEPMFTRLGWIRVADSVVQGQRHVLMRWPLDGLADLLQTTKSPLGGLLAPLRQHPQGLGGPGFVGDDGAPVPGTDLIAASDAIVASIIERDPDWAGWCSVLVNLNDLSAMGAAAVGLTDSVAAPTRSFAQRIIGGVARAADAWGTPVLGGHTQIGTPASLSVTALGRTGAPVRSSGARSGDRLSLTADLSGSWRRGFGHRQWDSSSSRSPEQLRDLAGTVGRARPAAAKDVSMAGLVGTAAMLAEASGCGATVDLDRIPTPAGASLGDWVSCFPGFGMLTADPADRGRMHSAFAETAEIGSLEPAAGVRLRWPDGVITTAVAGAATGLGWPEPASGATRLR